MSKLKKIRESKNLSRKELAELAGVNPVTIANYETGAHDINRATVSIVRSLAAALGCKIVDLLELEDVQ